MGKFINFGKGWKKESKSNGKRFLSFSTKSKNEDWYVDVNPQTKAKVKTKLFLEVEGEKPIEVSNFNVFQTEVDKDQFPNAPDYTLTFVLND